MLADIVFYLLGAVLLFGIISCWVWALSPNDEDTEE